MYSCFRASSTATCRTRATFARSDGWKLSGPSSIHRCAPFVTTPVTWTATRSAIDPMRASFDTRASFR